MIDELLTKVQARFRTYVESGRSDHSLVLSDEAEDEARELWKEEIGTKTAITQTARPGVLEALAWLHWARYYALPQGVDRNDLQAAVIFFAIIYMVYPDGVPDQLREILDSGEALDVQDALGIPAQHPSSYVSDQYPSAVERYLAIIKELTPVPGPSEGKPDINGLREGDRVRLIKAFNGETSSYEAGKEGTVLVTNTSPAHINLERELDLHAVVIDGGGLIMASGADIQKIPGHAKVIYSEDGESVQVILEPGADLKEYGGDNYDDLCLRRLVPDPRQGGLRRVRLRRRVPDRRQGGLRRVRLRRRVPDPRQGGLRRLRLRRLVPDPRQGSLRRLRLRRLVPDPRQGRIGLAHSSGWISASPAPIDISILGKQTRARRPPKGPPEMIHADGKTATIFCENSHFRGVIDDETVAAPHRHLKTVNAARRGRLLP